MESNGVKSARKGMRAVCLEGIVLLSVFAAACAIAAAYLGAVPYKPHHKPYRYGAAAMIATGHGFVKPGLNALPALDTFLKFGAESWDPAELPETVPHTPPEDWQRSHHYLLYAVALCWRLFGFSWDALVPLHALFFAASCSLAYGLFRLGMNRWIAAAAAVCFMISPAHLQMIPELRDYSKAPFILGTMFVLGWLVTRPLRPWRLLGLSGLLGGLLGLGLGFRLDMLICLMPAVLTLAFLVPGWRRREIAFRGAAVCALLLCFGLVGFFPIKTMRELGSTSSHNITGGLYRGFDSHFGLRPSYYQSLPLWNDFYIHETVASHHYRVNGIQEEIRYFTPESSEAGKGFLRSYGLLFPADIVLRAYATVLRMLETGPAWIMEGYGHNAPLLRAMGVLSALMAHLSHFGRFYAVAALLLIAVRNFRWALFAFCALLYFGGYPSLQFLPRHAFHLSFLSFWAPAFLLCQGLSGVLTLRDSERRRRAWALLRSPRRWWGRGLGSALGFAFLALILVFPPMLLLRGYQDRQVHAYTRAIAAADTERLEVKATSESEHGPVRWKPEGLFAGRPAEEVARGTATEYLCVLLGGDAATVPVQVSYSAANAAASDFSMVVYVPVRTSRGGELSRFYFPVYHAFEESQFRGRSFQGVLISRQHAPRFKGLYRVKDLAPFPVLPVLTLPPGWEAWPGHKEILSGARDHSKIMRRVLSAKKNRLQYGSFETWDAGAIAPEGFTPPRRHSTLERERQAVVHGEYAVRQTWSASDGADSIFNKFHLRVRLKPNTRYELWVNAKNMSEVPVGVSVWRYRDMGGNPDLRRIALNVVHMRPTGRFEERGGIFRTTGEDNVEYLFPTSYTGEGVPATVVWDNWRLLELP